MSQRKSYDDEGESIARKRWRKILSVISESRRSASFRQQEGQHSDEAEGLIDQLRREKDKGKHNKPGDNVLSLLARKDQSHGIQREKSSAREILAKRAMKRKSSFYYRKSVFGMDEGYGAAVQARYPTTPEIEEKLLKIAARNHQNEEKSLRPSLLKKLLNASILGQTLLANPRFYSLEPHIHLPDLCRRCRRPLYDTLESRFSIAGLVFAFLIPILGILLLFANREFYCVVCGETYVYGDLTARPVQIEPLKEE